MSFVFSLGKNGLWALFPPPLCPFLSPTSDFEKKTPWPFFPFFPSLIFHWKVTVFFSFFADGSSGFFWDEPQGRVPSPFLPSFPQAKAGQGPAFFLPFPPIRGTRLLFFHFPFFFSPSGKTCCFPLPPPQGAVFSPRTFFPPPPFSPTICLFDGDKGQLSRVPPFFCGKKLGREKGTPLPPPPSPQRGPGPFPFSIESVSSMGPFFPFPFPPFPPRPKKKKEVFFLFPPPFLGRGPAPLFFSLFFPPQKPKNKSRSKNWSFLTPFFSVRRTQKIFKKPPPAFFWVGGGSF